MALLNFQPTAEEMTRDQLAINLRAAYLNLAAFLENVKQTVWHNAHGLTPEQVLAVVDKDGLELRTHLESLVTVVDAVLPEDRQVKSWIAEGKDVTTNPDGTLTVIKATG